MARSTTLPPSQLQLEEEEGQEPAKTNSSFDEEDDEDMAPQPDDDLFIEPAGDYDVIYGDSNSTMASTSGTRPYLRLNSYLRNATKEEGEQARFKCEAAGSPLPLTFSWLKNHAPLDKNGKRVRIRNRDYWSRLVITDLDVLDSGHYQCIVTNPVGSVNTTGVLRVQKPKDFASRRRPQQRPLDYDDLSVSTVDHDQIPGRLPADWVPGPNFVPNGDQSTSESHVWLDGVKLNKGDCILYQGEACKHLLAGRYVMVTTTNREEMLDIDRNLRAAMMFINTSPKISDECKQHSHVVACYHKYKLCDGPNSVGTV